jgi:hypothetical protein
MSSRPPGFHASNLFLLLLFLGVALDVLIARW